MKTIRTQVAIVGAGPAGLMLGHLLHLQGIDAFIVEARSREYVIDRVRAGVLEQATVDLMIEAGVGDRLKREGLVHEGIYINVRGQRRHIDMASLTGGRRIVVYGQNEVVKDLLEARARTDAPLVFEAAGVSVHDIDSERPAIRFTKDGDVHELRCDFVAGCDGFHGICRPSIPPEHLRIFERVYPFGWLGILANAAPSCPELVYSSHDRGFALFSMRSNTVTRLYLQCEPDEDVAQWPDDRIWEELLTRHHSDDGWKPIVGPITQKSVAALRSFVVEPMRFGRLFLAGDAAHIVPPTGAKGMNLAVADVWRLSRALIDYFTSGRGELLDRYSHECLSRVWRAQWFSWWMTTMLHRVDSGNQYDDRRQLAELEQVTTSRAAMTLLAENYVGFPLEHGSFVRRG